MDDVKQMLFTLQRFHILALYTNTSSERSVSDSYAYAWSQSVYPFLNHTAYWHQAYETCFGVRQAQLIQLHEFLLGRWRAQSPLTFYDLEDHYGIRGSNRPGILWTQRSLASACRYLYLHGQFDNVFWSAMLDNGQAPVEAEGLTRRFDSDSVFFE